MDNISRAVNDRIACDQNIFNTITHYRDNYMEGVSASLVKTPAQKQTIFTNLSNNPVPPVPDTSAFSGDLINWTGAKDAVRDYGVPTDGVTDGSVQLNNAILDTATNNEYLVIPNDVTVTLTNASNPILIPSNSKVWWQPGSTCISTYTSTGSNAVFMTPNLTSLQLSTGVKWYGGTFKKPSTTVTGRIFNLNFSGTLEGGICDTVGGNSSNGGGALFLSGGTINVGHWIARNLATTGGCAGCRLFGCTNSFNGYWMNVVAGDQAFQCSVADTGPQANLNFNNVSYSTCCGGSYAQIIAVVLINPTGVGGLTASINSFSYNFIAGFSNNRNDLIENQDSTGAIQNGHLSNLFIDSTNDARDNVYVFFKNSKTPFLAGGVKNITTFLWGVLNPGNSIITKSDVVNVDTTGVDFVQVPSQLGTVTMSTTATGEQGRNLKTRYEQGHKTVNVDSVGLFVHA